MEVARSDRGFQCLSHPTYLERDMGNERIVSQSSAIGNYDDAMDRPGSSFLWVGQFHHLNREDVKELRDHLTHWLKTGKLE